MSDSRPFKIQLVLTKRNLALLSLMILTINSIFLFIVVLVLNNYAVTIDNISNLKVTMTEQFEINAKVDDSLDIPIHHTLNIPIDLQLNVPIKTDIHVSDTLDVDMLIPLKMTLTEKELSLRDLVVPIETDILIDEVFQVETVVPIDTTVKTYAGVPVKVKADLPVNVAIPVNQTIHVSKNLRVDLNKFALNIDTKVPIKTTFQINQPINTKGRIPIHLQEKLSIPLDEVLPIRLKEDIQTVVDVDQDVPIKMSQIAIDYKSIGIKKREETDTRE